MKLTVEIIIVFLAILWLAELKITFKPLHISLTNWRSALGIVLIVVGAGVYYNAAYRKGWNKAIDKTIEIIDAFKSEKNKNQ